MNGSTDSSSSMRRRATSTKHNNQLVSDSIWANARSAQLALVMTILAACGGDATVGNSSLNVVVPDGGADDIDIQRVDYTIQCDGNADAFLDSSDSFDDAVLVEGSLEVVDGRESNGVPTEVWQAFMDLPPGPCVLQLTASDNDGEVICAAQDTFTVDADATTKINLVLVCNVSYQAPAGAADVDATFSFVVGNFCPDLFVLNALGEPQQVVWPSGVVAGTHVEVRGRDADGTCGQNCDPQSCDNTVVPPVCTPGSDPGVSITLSVDNGELDCDDDQVADGQSCTLMGDQLTTGSVFFVCDFSTPGAASTVTATITDGDLDCDKSKEVQISCGANSNMCDALDEGDGCDAGTGTNSGTCVSGTCVAGPCTADDDGEACETDTGSGAGVCSGGICTSLDECRIDIPCVDTDVNVCIQLTCDTSAVPHVCVQRNVSNQLRTVCESGEGSGAGVCVDGECVNNDQCSMDAECNEIDGTQCTTAVCDRSGSRWMCVEDPSFGDGNVCPLPENSTGTCDAGVCSSLGGPKIAYNYVDCLSWYLPPPLEIPLALPITYNPLGPLVAGMPTDVEITGVVVFSEPVIAALLDRIAATSREAYDGSISFDIGVENATPSIIELSRNLSYIPDVFADSDGNGALGPLELAVTSTVTVTPDPGATSITFAMFEEMSQSFHVFLDIDGGGVGGPIWLGLPGTCYDDVTIVARSATFDVN